MVGQARSEHFYQPMADPVGEQPAAVMVDPAAVVVNTQPPEKAETAHTAAEAAVMAVKAALVDPAAHTAEAEVVPDATGTMPAKELPEAAAAHMAAAEAAVAYILQMVPRAVQAEPKAHMVAQAEKEDAATAPRTQTETTEQVQ